MDCRIEVAVVDAHHEGVVGAVTRSRDDHERCAALEVSSSGVALGEDAGGLDDHVDTEVAPGQVGRIALAEDLEHVATDGDASVDCLDVFREDSED